MTTRRLAALLAATALFAPSTVFASGFEQPENVTRAVGRGGAYVVAVDEASAVYFNPAALTRIDGFNTTLNMNLVDLNFTFQRADYTFLPGEFALNQEATIHYEEEQNQGGIQPTPMLFFAHDFGLEAWGFGFGLYGPSAYGQMEWDTMNNDDPQAGQNGVNEVTRNGGNAYMLINDFTPLIYPSLSAAYRIENLNLSIGITAQVALFWANIAIGADASGFNSGDEDITPNENQFDDAYRAEENPEFFTETELNTFAWAPTGILGLLWEPLDSLGFAATFRPGFALNSTGTVDIVVPQRLSSTNAQLFENDQPCGDECGASLDTHLPDVVRLGAMYRFRDSAGRERANVELDWVFERWSTHEAFVSRIDGEMRDDALFPDGRSIPVLTLPREYDNAWSIRLGSDLRMFYDDAQNKGLILRVGTLYETGTSPEEYTNLDFPSFDRFAGSLGASYHVGRVSIDLGFMHIQSPERVVDNGAYELIVPLWICYDPPTETIAATCADNGDAGPSHAVNNGTYNVNYQIYSLGMTYGW